MFLEYVVSDSCLMQNIINNRNTAIEFQFCTKFCFSCLQSKNNKRILPTKKVATIKKQSHLIMVMLLKSLISVEIEFVTKLKFNGCIYMVILYFHLGFLVAVFGKLTESRLF